MSRRNTLGVCASVRRWTNVAVECYERGCVCNGCYYNEFFKENGKCHMKATVLELVRKLGTPPNSNIIRILQD